MRDEVIDMEESDFYTLVNTDRMGIFLIYYNNSDYLKKAQKYGQITG